MFLLTTKPVLYVCNVDDVSAAGGNQYVCLLYTSGAEAKEIKGKVMADGKGLAKVVVTDGTAFALTSEDGSYMIDADEKLTVPYSRPSWIAFCCFSPESKPTI